MRNNPVHPCIRRRRAAARPAGFTLMELLIVILIIGVLVSIIIPVASKARQLAQAANTKALIANLGSMITAYQGDFNAYPGPLSNMEVYATLNGTPPGILDGPTVATIKSVKMDGRSDFITMSENLVLGLNGGLRRVGDEIQYDTAWVGGGPQWLGGTPKRLPAYGENTIKDLSTRNIEAAGGGGAITGDYVDGNGTTGDDSPVPEYVDRFNEPLPILVLRARPGARTTANTAPDNPVMTDGSNAARPGQYDYSQIAGYVSGTTGNIGVGRQLKEGDYRPKADFPRHGLRESFDPAVATTTDPSSPGYTYPYNAYVAIRNHALSGLPGSAGAGNPVDVPKQKDSYILISAGIDRVYGTSDDITNFGSY